MKLNTKRKIIGTFCVLFVAFIITILGFLLSNRSLSNIGVEYIRAENKTQMVLIARDKEENKKWNYVFKNYTKENEQQNFYIGIKNEIVYILDDGELKGLDYNTGELLWTNPDIKTTYIKWVFDHDGILYLCGDVGYTIIGVNMSGQTIFKNGSYQTGTVPKYMDIKNENINIIYQDYSTISYSISDNSINADDYYLTDDIYKLDGLKITANIPKNIRTISIRSYDNNYIAEQEYSINDKDSYIITARISSDLDYKAELSKYVDFSVLTTPELMVTDKFETEYYCNGTMTIEKDNYAINAFIIYNDGYYYLFISKMSASVQSDYNILNNVNDNVIKFWSDSIILI